MPLLRIEGAFPLRFAERRSRGMLTQEPPRKTRREHDPLTFGEPSVARPEYASAATGSAGVDGDEEVHAVLLRAVAGVEEKADGIGAAAFSFLPKRSNPASIYGRVASVTSKPRPRKRVAISAASRGGLANFRAVSDADWACRRCSTPPRRPSIAAACRTGRRAGMRPPPRRRWRAQARLPQPRWAGQERTLANENEQGPWRMGWDSNPR